MPPAGTTALPPWQATSADGRPSIFGWTGGVRLMKGADASWRVRGQEAHAQNAWHAIAANSLHDSKPGNLMQRVVKHRSQNKVY